MAYAIVALLLSPFIILIFRVRDVASPFRPEFFEVLGQSFFQAASSSFICLVLGIFGAFGLLSISRQSYRRAAEIFVMLPNLIPTLFVIISSINLVTLFTEFPFGIKGVVFVHVVMNVGFVSVACAHLIQNSLGASIELATVEGASRFAIWRVTLGGLKRELLLIAFLIFSLSFMSFSVPLIVGGSRGDTIEALIYRAILGQGDLPYGLGLAIIQILFLGFFSLLIQRPKIEVFKKNLNLKLVTLPSGFFGLVLLTLIILFSSFVGFTSGLSEIALNQELRSRLFFTGLGSFAECTMVAFLILGFLLAVSFVWPHTILQKFLNAYSAPSAVLTGLAIFLIFESQGANDALVLFWISFAFALSVLSLIYRFGGAAVISSIEPQIISARVLGASRGLIFKEIILPQIWRQCSFLAGMGALWASGDFALASLISGKEMTLAMMAHTLMGGYRIEVATVLSWFSLIVGVFIFLIFEVVGRVGYSKSRL